MNSTQLFAAIKTKLLARVWGASANKVFNQDSVVVSVAIPSEALKVLIPPIAIIKPGSATSDPEADEEADLILQKFSVIIVTYSENDTLGEGCLVGACVADATKSEGKGIFQIEEELFNAIESLETGESVTIFSRAKGAPDAVLDDGLYIAWRDYDFEALVTATQS